MIRTPSRFHNYVRASAQTRPCSHKVALAFTPTRVLIGDVGSATTERMRPLERSSNVKSFGDATSGGVYKWGVSEGWVFGGESGRELFVRHSGKRVVIQ
jgi:hypothetical protein